MTEVQLLRGSVESLQRQRDEWVAKHKECTQLLGEALQDTTNVSIERDALKDAARLALDALEKSTPKPRKGDDDYCERGWRDQSYAVAALKAVL